MELQKWLGQEDFTLCMSSGFFSFFAHCGMLSVLEEHRRLPVKVAGSSAGSLVAACWAAGMNTADIRQLFFDTQKQDIWDPGFGKGLLKGNKFRDLLREALPVSRIEETRVPLSVSVYDIRRKKTLSYQSGDLPTLVSASCAVPFLFHPVKYESRAYLDGGIKDRPGLEGIANGERVFYHHILSRSPWRKKSDPALQIPARENMASLAIRGLTRSGPNKLHLGPIAYEQAREATLQALSQCLDKQGNLYINASPAQPIAD